MSRLAYFAVLTLASFLAITPDAWAQPRPYIGFVYPAGGQQGTTFQVRVGGQGIDGVDQAIVSGTGVSAKVIEYRRRLGSQEVALLREQRNELRRASSATEGEATRKIETRIEQRIAEYVNTPACASISNIVIVEVTVKPDATPGQRELRVATPRGLSNPLVFCIGQLPEVSRKPMVTAERQVLGKEQLALRKRPESEVEDEVTVPCTLNGQIASGEVNRYRFRARKGQRLVISTEARQLVPFIADAVPGWFQPVLVLYDAHGKEVAYDDDYRFNPDPTILFQVPKTGEYVLAIYDSLYRGREDFVYRISLGETPFLTSIFPLGGLAGNPPTVEMNGWNLQNTELTLPPGNTGPGIHLIAAHGDRVVSNWVPFLLDTLPECFEKEPNDDAPHAQEVELPININGRIDRRDDWDVFQFKGHAGETVVAEVYARRLDSPLDSVLKLTDAAGKLLTYNDDHEDPAPTVNTHYADSYLTITLPADGTYYVHLGDTARNGGVEYAYRLRLSAPQPDFALRIVPSSVSLRSKSATVLKVQVIRKDGFAGPVKLGLKNPPPGFMTQPSSVAGNQAAGVLRLRTTLLETKQPVALRIEGRAQIQGREVTHTAVPAEDRMQAFLWRHFVPAEELSVKVVDPSYVASAKRTLRVRPPSTASTKPSVPAANSTAAKPKFSKQQVAGRLRQLKSLYENGLLTDDFYDRKVAECEAAL